MENLVEKYSSGFSKGLDDYFGEKNIVPYCYFSDIMNYSIKKSVVELICLFFGYQNSWLPDEKVVANSEHSTIRKNYGKFYETFYLTCADKDGHFVSWEGVGDKIEGRSFVSLYAYCYHCYESDAVEELFELYCSKFWGRMMFGDDILLSKGLMCKDYLSYIPFCTSFDLALGVLDKICCESDSYSRSKSLPMVAPGSSLIGYVDVYCCPDKRDIALPSRAFCSKDTMELGGKHVNKVLIFGHPFYLYLYNVALLEKHKSAKVILCEDLLVAAALDEILKDSKRYSCVDYISTSWYGMFACADLADFNILQNRDVVFVPALSRESYKNIKFYNDKLKDVSVKSFHISRDPVVRFDTDGGFDVWGLGDLFERYIANNHFILQRCESHVLYSICEKSIDFSSYKNWCINVGLDVGMASELSQEAEVSRVPNINKILPTNNDQGKIYFSEFFSKDYLTAIVGGSDSGKSIVGLSLGLAMVYGFDLFCFNRSNKVSILYVDGENASTDTDSFISSMVSSYNLNGDDIVNFRHILFKNIEDAGTISDTSAREKIESEIRRHNTSVVFFDNLMSLSKHVYENSGKWKDLNVWFGALSRRFSVAVVFIHHTNKENETKGVIDVESSSQNIITIDDASAVSGTDRLASVDSSTERQKMSAHILRMKFKKCKHYHSLKNKEFFYCLQNDSEQNNHPLWDEVSLYEGKIKSKSTETNYFDDAVIGHQLDPRCKIILEYASSHVNFKRNEIDELLHCKESTSQNLIASLVKEQRLDILGKGKNTRYKLRKDQKASEIA